jgi:hypothetical protein
MVVGITDGITVWALTVSRTRLIAFQSPYVVPFVPTVGGYAQFGSWAGSESNNLINVRWQRWCQCSDRSYATGRSLCHADDFLVLKAIAHDVSARATRRSAADVHADAERSCQHRRRSPTYRDVRKPAGGGLHALLLARQCDVNVVYVVAPAASALRLLALLELCIALGVSVQTVPIAQWPLTTCHSSWQRRAWRQKQRR